MTSETSGNDRREGTGGERVTGRRMGDWEKTERLRGGRKACDVKEGG